MTLRENEGDLVWRDGGELALCQSVLSFTASGNNICRVLDAGVETRLLNQLKEQELLRHVCWFWWWAAITSLDQNGSSIVFSTETQNKRWKIKLYMLIYSHTSHGYECVNNKKSQRSVFLNPLQWRTTSFRHSFKSHIDSLTKASLLNLKRHFRASNEGMVSRFIEACWIIFNEQRYLN